MPEASYLVALYFVTTTSGPQLQQLQQNLASMSHQLDSPEMKRVAWAADFVGFETELQQAEQMFEAPVVEVARLFLSMSVVAAEADGRIMLAATVGGRVLAEIAAP